MSDLSKKILLLVMSSLIALIAGEVILRAIGYGTITPELNFGVNTKLSLDRGQFAADPDLFWVLPPHALDKQVRAVQPNTPVPPKGSARRVLVLGDSCSKISQKIFPYSALLEDSLGSDVEVWNAAVPGYTSWQGKVWLQKQLLAMRPDVAVIYFGWNDHWRSTGIADVDYAEQQKPGSLKLLRLLQDSPEESPLRVSLAQYKSNLSSMVADLNAQGTRVILVAAPSHLTAEARRLLVTTGYMLPTDNAVTLHRDYLMVVKQVADDTDAVMLNASGLFARLDAPTQLIMRDGIHLTDRGHQVMASVLAEACGAALIGGPVATGAELAKRASDAFPAVKEGQ
ncbi:MAG: lysophospholipase L1-like esterase [Candidatus Krumholzibacteriia bacterium]